MCKVLPILALAAALPTLSGQIPYSNPPTLVDTSRTRNSPPRTRETVNVDVNLVLVPVTVTDRSGQSGRADDW